MLALAQVVLGGVAVDLVVDAAILATLCDRTNHVDPWRDEQLGAGRAGVLTTVLRLRNHGVSSPKAKKTLRNRGKGPPFCFLNARVSL